MNTAAEVYGQAAQALNSGDFATALTLVRPLLSVVPDHPGVRFIAGVAALELGDLPLALQMLSSAKRLTPERPEYGAYLARAFAAAGLMREAVETADEAVTRPISNPLTLDILGVVYTQANAYAKAAPLFARAVALQPALANYRFNLATSLMFKGDLDMAEREYEACIALAPQHWKAHLALSQMRRQTPSSNHLDRLRGLLHGTAEDRLGQLYVHLALAKEFEDLGNHPEAFGHLKAGKSAGGAARRYKPERDEQLFSDLMRAFPEPVTRLEGHSTDEPIFVFGMPRSGTTLVERILSSHPEVQSAGELPNFSIALKRQSGSRTAALLDEDVIQRALRIDPRRLGEAYLASTRPGTGSSPHFVDKLPHNFLFAGFIARSLPHARLICVRRNPMDTVLGNFRQLFALDSPFYDYSYDVVDTARYFVLFDRLMSHWNQVLPGRILEVRYESLVDHQEATTRAMLEHCGLDWDAGCLTFETNEAPVATASVVQVRQPMNRSSIGRWKLYESQLTKVRALLSAAGLAV